MKAYPDTGHLIQQQEELFLWKQVEMPKRLDALDSILPEFHSLALVFKSSRRIDEAYVTSTAIPVFNTHGIYNPFIGLDRLHGSHQAQKK